MTTHVKLAEGVQGTHLTVAHVGGPHHMHQAPAFGRSTIMKQDNKVSINSLLYVTQIVLKQSKSNENTIFSLVIVEWVSRCEV